MGWWAWLLLVTGGYWPGSAPTVWYNEESGFLSIILPPLLQVAGIALLFWWHHQCHVHGCFWPTRRTTAAGERACWRHDPRGRRTVADLHAAHHHALAALHGRPQHGEDPR